MVFLKYQAIQYTVIPFSYGGSGGPYLENEGIQMVSNCAPRACT